MHPIRLDESRPFKAGLDVEPPTEEESFLQLVWDAFHTEADGRKRVPLTDLQRRLTAWGWHCWK